MTYKDDRDKAYGAAGMAIGLVIFDGEDLLVSISLDDKASARLVSLSEDFYFAGNQGDSAKSAWHRILKHYNIGMAMLIGNRLCRSMVQFNADIDADALAQMRALVCDEGHESCSLDDDEINRLFDKNYTYLRRVFSHGGVKSLAHDFASTLITRRSLSRMDVLEILSALNAL